jgi:hypothetical protein
VADFTGSGCLSFLESWPYLTINVESFALKKEYILKTKMPVYLPFVVVDLHHKQIHIFRSLPWLSL